MDTSKTNPSFTPLPQLSPSFFDDPDKEEVYDFTPSTINLKLPDNISAYDRFMVVNMNKNTATVGLFTLVDHYIVSSVKENGEIRQLSAIDAGKARVYEKKVFTHTDGFDTTEEFSHFKGLNHAEFSFSLVKNGTMFQFISDKEESVDAWIERLRLISIHTNYHQQFTTIEQLGSGSFSRVYLVEHKLSHAKFAVKAFKKVFLSEKMKDNAKECLENEINIMKVLHHKNIVELYKVFETENSIYLVMEYVNGKTLEKFLSEDSYYFEEKRSKKLIQGILAGLSFLASKRIMHRDLKPDNILIDDDDNPKIIDLGFATFIDEKEYIIPRCGTAGYIAPEVFRYMGSGPRSYYNDRCDIFSLGCIFFRMLFGERFIKGLSADSILHANQNYNCDNESFSMIADEFLDPGSRISQDALDFLMRLIEYKPKSRPTAAQCLRLPYISNFSKSLSTDNSSSQDTSEVPKAKADEIPLKTPGSIESDEKWNSSGLISPRAEGSLSEISTPRKNSFYLNNHVGSNSPNVSSKVKAPTPDSLTSVHKEHHSSSIFPTYGNGSNLDHNATKPANNNLLKKALINETMKHLQVTFTDAIPCPLSIIRSEKHCKEQHLKMAITSNFSKKNLRVSYLRFQNKNRKE